MLWPFKLKETETTQGQLTERELAILQLLQESIDMNKKLVDKLEEMSIKVGSLQEQVEKVAEASINIPQRQDTLIKLFMQYADQVLPILQKTK